MRILSQPALVALQNVLGTGIGLGLAKRRPTKARPVEYCTIGGILTSIECGAEAPYKVVLNPDCQCTVDGIDFIYSEQNRFLSCTVHFSKITVTDEAVAKSRIATAEVTLPVSGVYLNVWFQYHDSLLEVIEINGDSVTCSYVEEETGNIILPVNLVSQLVSRFGNN